MAKSQGFSEDDPERLVLWNLRLPFELLERLRARAEDMDRPASWLARKFITEGLARKKSVT